MTDGTVATDSDVAIVGAGPVGQVLAILLGLRGWRVELAERRLDPYGLPRAVHLDHEAARILQSAGVMADLEPLTEVMDAYEWRSAHGATLLRFGVEGVGGCSGWPESAMFAQPDLERILAAKLATLPSVTTRRGCEVVALHQDPDPASAVVGVTTRGPNGHRSVRTARWVVGCDGAQSGVRAMLGIDQEDLGYFFDWLIVDVVPDHRERWRPLNIQVCDPRRPTTAVSGGPGRRRWEFMRLPGETTASLAGIDRAWQLLEPWGVTPGNATMERHAVYTFSARLAQRWALGRVALAGDAAHQMPPFAGQGLCCGLRDAANLAWRLDLMLAGRAPAKLIDSYGSERGPQVRTAIQFSIDLGRIICVADPAEAAARDESMTAAAAHSGAVLPPPPPPIGPGVTLGGDPQAGQLGRQGAVAHRGRRGRFDDVVARGWVLLSASAGALDDLDPEIARWWTDLGGTAVHVGPGAAVDDLDGTYGRWFADTGAGVIVQRPDFAVFGTAADRSGASTLLRAARAALTS